VPAGTGVAFSGGGACEGNASVQSIGVSPFLELMPQPRWIESSPLSIALKLPDYVRAGETLRYQVTLTNASGAPFHFHGECPSYVEDGSRTGSKIIGAHELNCTGISWLAPNQTVTFAMELDFPASTPPGPGELRWSLHSAYGGAQAVGLVTVTAR
jgi:hypothetical protein